MSNETQTNQALPQDAAVASTKISTGSAILWASAIALVALIIVQAGRLPGQAAYAGMADSRGHYSAMTAASGEGDVSMPSELLYIIDSRDETLMVYEIGDARKGNLILRDGGSLQNLFNAARR